jgi:hypothetical protein
MITPDHVQIDRQEVANAAAQHKAVPDRMVVRNALTDVENNAQEYTTPPTASNVTPPAANLTAS